MDQSLKERLVGAAVLVGLAVWLVPWVLDGPVPDADFEAVQSPVSEGEAPLRTQTIRLDQGQVSAARIDAAEPIDAGRVSDSISTEEPDREPASASTLEMPLVPPPELAVADAAPADPSGISAETSAATPADLPAEASGTASIIVPPEAPAPGWVVQLGSFGEEENARRLADRVATLGYAANLSTHTAGGRLMYRVRVGPEPNRESAADIASSLTAQGFVAQVVSSN